MQSFSSISRVGVCAEVVHAEVVHAEVVHAEVVHAEVVHAEVVHAELGSEASIKVTFGRFNSEH